ncbi:type III secretion system chaperone family protein [Sediminitomix flava]|uniref:Sensory transduction regulator n=1 Tax=Sediminitomix flava TaxID=379075 RepID=A0A315Z6V8_SEDFL|nr:molecular chaperone Tir [Sediminitomix flava]PWJ40168.1 hypothetical protein BC781_105236 [Sediminitomix flava]
MSVHFDKVKGYLLELGFDIKHEDQKEELFIIDSEDDGIVNLVVDCEDPILVIEMMLFDINTPSQDMFKELLIKNREIVHGAFALNEEGNKLLFRDTLQLENLDLNELEGSINALSLLMGEYYQKLLEFAKN